MLVECYDEDFTHAKQSLRVADKLENLNLTYEVLDGILNHSGTDKAFTPEGSIVKYADRIAYINHDIDDAIRAGILTPESIPIEIRRVLGDSSSKRINTLIRAIVCSSEGKPDITMDDEIYEAMNDLRSFLFANVYTSSDAKAEEGKAEKLLTTLFMYYFENPDKMPNECRKIAEEEGVGRATCDFIAGMTDRYAINDYKRIFIPEVWGEQKS